MKENVYSLRRVLWSLKWYNFKKRNYVAEKLYHLRSVLFLWEKNSLIRNHSKDEKYFEGWFEAERKTKHRLQSHPCLYIFWTSHVKETETVRHGITVVPNEGKKNTRRRRVVKETKIIIKIVIKEGWWR